MASRRIALALLGVVIAACGGGTAPVEPGTPQVVISTPEATPVPSVAVADPSPSATTMPTLEPTPKASPKPTARPTPQAVPPQPSGVRYQVRDVSDYCPPDSPDTCSIDWRDVTISWSRPRTKSVTVRVYGVTKCFGTDADGQIIDGDCLRKHTALPSSVRVLLGTAPASRGKLTIRMVPSPYLAESVRGIDVFSIVLTAYNAEGQHSIFTIAQTIEYCMVAADDVACLG